ncbi:MAG: porphobilinogen synthase [Bdellovibrionales bacterium]|nr:porphobilinogen synthase [Bdellovibrionales bacterium]
MSLPHRPRRNRRTASIREMTQEIRLCTQNLVMPLFLTDQDKAMEPIHALPGQFRYGPDRLIDVAGEAFQLGIPAIALFPKIADNLKDPLAKESANPQGLLPQTIRDLKQSLPELTIISDVAMDPYSSEGHDGIVSNGKILNDESLQVLGEMALVQAQAGVDYVAPSDMMDGRVAYIRNILDKNGYSEVGIISYSAKFASCFYGPFREALDSNPKSGDKKSYQLNPANRREALREVLFDQEEGADMLLVKPALSYLDIISMAKEHCELPIAAYNVSGEYAMIKAAAEKSWLDERSAVLESLLSIRRAGADVIFTYWAMDVARWLRDNSNQAT